MKEKCDDKEWMHCRVEKMGCEGCNYEDRPYNPKELIFMDYITEMKDLYLKKNHDYGDSVSKTFDEYGLTSFLVRMDDTLLDLANYAVLALTEIEYRKKLLLSEQTEIDPDAEYSKKDLEITYNAMHNIKKCEGTE